MSALGHDVTLPTNDFLQRRFKAKGLFLAPPYWGTLPKEEEFLLTLDSMTQAVIECNSSWELEQMTQEHFEVSGKRIRPRMIYQIGQLLDLHPEKLVSWATSCEVLHNATLVHDDLQDGDEARRGVPTTWVKYGPQQAINVGDFLLLVSSQPLLHAPLSDEFKLELSYLHSRVAAQIVNGQAREFEINKLENLDHLLVDYLEVIARKTSALFSGMAQGCGIIAELDSQELSQWEMLFFELGNLFQIQDDVLDLFGDKGRGEYGCDIKEGKISYLVALHLTHNRGDLDLFKTILNKKRQETTQADVDVIKTEIESSETKELALREIDRRIHSILGRPILNTRPGLKLMVEGMIRDILTPIKHLDVTFLELLN